MRTAESSDAADSLAEDRWRTPALTFLAMAAVLYTVVWLAHAFLPDAAAFLPHPGPGDDPPPVPLEAVFGGWVHWDAGWYVSIAETGYYYVRDGQSPIAFFPAYPLTMRAAEPLFGSAALVGIAVTFLCGLAVALLWWRWLLDHLTSEARRLAWLLLVFWPYAWYLYGAVYADALFLAATLAAFVLVDHDRPVLAGVAGAVATAGRPVGIAVTVGLVAVLAHRRLSAPDDARFPRDPKGLRRYHGVRLFDLGVVVSLAGLAAWCLWLWAEFDDPFAFIAAQEQWGQGAGPSTWLKFDFFEHVLDRRRFAVVLLPHAVATIAFLCAVPAVWRRFGWGYGTYTLAVVAIPALGSGSFQGLSRYLMAAFPVYAVAGEWLAERSTWSRRVIPLSAASLVVGAALFSMGFYLA